MEPRARTTTDLHISSRFAIPSLCKIAEFLLYPLYAKLPNFLNKEQRHQFLVFAKDENLDRLVRWINRLSKDLAYPDSMVSVARVNNKSQQSRKMLENAGNVVGPDWRDFNDHQCLRLTIPCPKNQSDIQSHRFHMTMARILLSHTEALVGYKYCNGIDNENLEEDVWVAHHWRSDQKVHTEHRVLPKRLAEPISRLIDVVSSLKKSSLREENKSR